MPEHQNINAAYRLYLILQAAVAKDAKWTQLQVWVAVFGLEHLSGRQQKQAVARGIDLIYEQLDQIIEQVKSKHFPQTAYRELQAKIEQHISPELMHHQWENFRAALLSQIFPLAILSAALPHEENLIDPEELTTIREDLDKFEQSLEDKDISTELRQYVKRQFSFMRRAIWEYQFRGLHAFEDAMLDTLREISVSRETVEKHKDDPEVQEVGKMWNKVWQAIIKAGQIGAALAGAERFYQLVESTLKISGPH